MINAKFLLPWFLFTIFCLGHSVDAQPPTDDSLEEKAIAAAVQRAEPSIVQIETIGGLERVGETTVNTGPTTGVVIDERGYIFSSTINFLQQPSAIFVRLPDGTRVPAERIATDTSRKLVLLKIDIETELVPIQLAAQAKLQVGQTTIALGRTYDIERPNPSIGILSAKGRIWDRAIQTDAKVSPANFGGPLIDLYGRMIGILVPLSPDSEETASGQEWYDSGIGFAVPVERALERMADLIAGNDQMPGKMGIAFRGTNIYDDPAIVRFRPEASPAALAGIQVGDNIVELNGQSISRQAQFRHAIGPLYAGELANIVVLRDEKRVPLQVELAASIEPFQPPAMGVLVGNSPGKSGATNQNVADTDVQQERNPTSGVIIEHVIPESPAAKSGLQTGDQLIRVDDQVINQRTDLEGVVLNARIGDDIEIIMLRDGEEQNVGLRVGHQTATPLPASYNRLADVPCNDATVVEIKVPEFANQAMLIAPDFEQAASPETGLLVWIARPGAVDKDDWLKTWKQHVVATRTAVLILAPADESKWVPGEREFIKRATDLARQQTNVSSGLMCIGGRKAGGAMAALTAFQYRTQFKGLILIDAILPNSVSNPETSPTNPLLVFLAQTNNDQNDAKPDAENIEATEKRLMDAHFPVHVAKIHRGPLKDFTEGLLRWVQTVDRF